MLKIFVFCEIENSKKKNFIHFCMFAFGLCILQSENLITQNSSSNKENIIIDIVF